MGYNQYLKQKRLIKAHRQQTIDLHKESLEKIRSHKFTRKITPQDFPSAFEYMDKIFPKANVRDCDVYIAKRSLLDRIGYKGVGGFYSKVEKIVVIPDEMPEIAVPKNTTGKTRWKSIRAMLTVEEILVHELCHYVSAKICTTAQTMQMEEEFAYGNMVDFCRSRGRTDEDIVLNVFLPYLFNVILQTKQYLPCKTDEDDRMLFESVMNEARSLGFKIIEIWDRKRKPEVDAREPKIVDNKKPINLDLD